MRRHLLTLLLAVALLVVGASVAAPVGAQGAPPCAGDRVTASIASAAASGARWSVTDACVDARDYFVGEVQGHPFAIGVSTVTYDDGHTGRLAFLAVRIDAAQTVTVIGMEDPASGELRFAGTVRQSAIGVTGATVSGAGITFPPLATATVALDFSDVAAPWPDWATGPSTSIPATTVPAVAPTTVAPATVAPTTVAPTTVAPTTVAPTTGPNTTTPPAVTSVETIPTVPGMELVPGVPGA